MPDDTTPFQSAVLTSAQHQQIARLLLRLGSKESAERWTAQTELRQMPPLPAPVLLAHMARLERVRRQSPFLLFLGLFASCLLLLGLLLVFDTVFGPMSHLPVLAATAAALTLMLRRWMRLRAAAIRAISNFNDVREIGPLALFLVEAQGDQEMQTIARALLIALLPRIQGQQAASLTVQQRDSLLMLLDSADTPLVLALLQALARVGDPAVEVRVRQLLIEKKPPEKGSGEKGSGEKGSGEKEPGEKEPRAGTANEQVHNAAQECLAALAALRIQQRLKNNLLRVVDSNGLPVGMPLPQDHSTKPQDTSTQGDNL